MTRKKLRQLKRIAERQEMLVTRELERLHAAQYEPPVKPRAVTFARSVIFGNAKAGGFR